MVLGGSLRFGSCRAALRVAGVLVKRVAVDACCRWFPLRLMLAAGSHRGRRFRRFPLRLTFAAIHLATASYIPASHPPRNRRIAFVT